MSAQTPIPKCEQLLEQHDVSYWLKNALRAAMERDPVDAVNDAELLAEVLRQRASGVVIPPAKAIAKTL